MPYIFPKLPRFFTRPGIFYRLLIGALFLSIGGCGREMQGMGESGGQKGALSMPDSGFVRIVSRRIEDRAGAPPVVPLPKGVLTEKAPSPIIHYKWSLIGERNWQNPKADKTGFTLGNVYALNSTTERGGCNIWECDLAARSFTPVAQSKPTSAVAWRLTIHGSNGQTAQAEGIAYQNTVRPVEEVVRVVQTRDEPVRLPADALLASLTDAQGQQEIRLRVADK